MTRQTRFPIERLSLTPYNRMAIDLYHQINKGQVLLDPPYQRGSVWTPDQQQDLMYSMLSGYPTGAVILNDRMRGGWGHDVAYAVIDGRQRLETIVSWFDGRLYIPASWLRPQMIRPDAQLRTMIDGRYLRLDDLTENGAAEVESRMPLATVVAHVDSLAGEAEIYRLVNAGGTAHTPEDLARAAEVEKEV